MAGLCSTTAHAYIGPGAGAGTIAIVLGVIASIFLAIIATVWYPLKRLFKSRKTAVKDDQTSEIDRE
jgi:hypothetical protein